MENQRVAIESHRSDKLRKSICPRIRAISEELRRNIGGRNK